MTKDYQKRTAKEFNKIREICQWIACNIIYAPFYKLTYSLQVVGRENVPKNGMLIIASNHVSAIDPFLVIHAVKRSTAYMAKIELFQKFLSRFFLDILGAFAVDRTKLSVSTIKTVKSLTNTNWCLGIFPQGTREKDGNMDNINKGFATFAKMLKCDILPVAITGAIRDKRKLFKSKMKITIGKPIPFTENIDEMVECWSQKINELSGGLI